MQSRKLDRQTEMPLSHLLTLIAGDLLVVLSFVWVGRSSHNLSLTAIGDALFTALPFIIGWFAISPWFGLYKAEISQNWRRLIPRLLIAWAIGGPLALALRALFLGRPLATGIIPTFALVSLGYIGLVALVWRLGYIWWAHRRSSQSGDMSQVRG